jgi:hypothetical protein
MRLVSRTKLDAVNDARRRNIPGVVPAQAEDPEPLALVIIK